MLVLGPIVDQHEDSGRGQALHQGIEEHLGFRVDPMQVFEQHDDRLDLTLAQQKALYTIERALASLQRVHPSPSGILSGNVEEPEERREKRFERAVERQKLP